MTQTKWIPMEVLERSQETSSLVCLKLTPRLEGFSFDFQAGQCARILTPRGEESIFAMASEPEEKRCVEFLIKDHEAGIAHELCRIQVGRELKISPPFGKGYPIERLKGKDVLLIGMGSGLAPLRSLLKSILRRDHQFGKITFLYGARTPRDIPFQTEFDVWAKKVDLHFAMSQPHDVPWHGFLGRVTHLLPGLHLQYASTVSCICGTRTMQEEVINLLERSGISKENILLNH